MRKIVRSICFLAFAMFVLFGCSEHRCLLNGCILRWPFTIGSLPIFFVADNNNINENLLIPVDIIVVENSDPVLEIGPENWFMHQKRDALLKDKEIYRLTLSSWEQRKISIIPGSDVKKIVIYADYEKIFDRNGQQIVIFPKTMDFTYMIKMTRNGMELVQ